jgi:hypothetical protein
MFPRSEERAGHEKYELPGLTRIDTHRKSPHSSLTVDLKDEHE